MPKILYELPMPEVNMDVITPPHPTRLVPATTRRSVLQPDGLYCNHKLILGNQEVPYHNQLLTSRTARFSESDVYSEGRKLDLILGNMSCSTDHRSPEYQKVDLKGSH